jgi:hypothetical protein
VRTFTEGRARLYIIAPICVAAGRLWVFFLPYLYCSGHCDRLVAIKHVRLLRAFVMSAIGTNLTLCSVVLFAAGSQGSLGRF